jgi:UDP-GlcNAc:undecaprenyl-phosphate GlcNAc-1-phosphate transferase
MSYILLAAAIAFLVALVFTPFVRRVAERAGIVAHPGGRRIHSSPTPLMGGLAMYLAFMVAVPFVIWLSPEMVLKKQAVGILIASTLVALGGILDDKYELPGWVQALFILAGGLILAFYGVRILYITSPVKIVLGLFSIPVTMIWVLMVTKAVDCMDGLDGLAAGICAIAALTLMIMAIETDRQVSAAMAAALLGGALGFLRFNYPPAKIFMGTIGAQFLGFTLAAISVLGAFKIPTLLAVVIPVLVLGVPLFDTTFVVLKRAVSGKKVHEADMTHLHHRLVGRGLTHRQTIWLIYGLTCVLCAAAYALFVFVKQ